MFMSIFICVRSMCNVSVLGREEGYTVKYGLSHMRDARGQSRSLILPNNDLLSFLGLIMRKQLKDQCNTHISIISESESPLGAYK